MKGQDGQNVIVVGGMPTYALGGDWDLYLQLNIANTWERLGLSILIGNIVAAVIAGLMAIIVVLYISHKIAGPLYRFESLCKQVGEGNLNTITHLRSNDQLQELAQSFSAMVDKLRNRREQKNKLLDDLNNEIGHLKTDSNLTPEHIDSIKKLEAIVGHIKNI